MIHERSTEFLFVVSVIVFFAGIVGHRMGAAEGRPVVLLQDDFETATVGSRLDVANKAWCGNDGSETQALVVSTEPSTPPHPKSKCWAKLDRATGGRSDGQLGVEDFVMIGGKLHISFMMFVERNDADKFPAAAVAEIGIGNTLAGQVNIVAGRGGDDRITSNDSNQTAVARNVKFKDGTWQNWQIWVDVDQKTYEYAVDGGKSGNLKMRYTKGSNVQPLKIIEIEPGTAGDMGKDSVIYLDDVSVTYQIPADRVAMLEGQRSAYEKQEKKKRELAEAAEMLRKSGNRDAYYLHGVPDDIGHRLQLFLDPSAYADRWDVYQRINQPQKAPNNPIMMPDQPWEHSIGPTNVLYDEQMQKFHMWYANYDTGKWVVERP